MACNCNESDDDDIDPAAIASNMMSAVKPELIKELLKNSFQDNKTRLGNDALTLVVEVAKCLVSETCLRASSHALGTSEDQRDQCLPQFMVEYP